MYVTINVSVRLMQFVYVTHLSSLMNFCEKVYGNDEWSYGYCEQGTGVFRCPSSKNPMYTYREKIVLGRTECTIFMVNQIFRELTREWPGHTYDLLSRNCNHFCDVLCERLGVPKLPGKAYYLGIRIVYMCCVGLEGICDGSAFVSLFTGWVNRFAHAGDTALEVAETTAMRVGLSLSLSHTFCLFGT